MFSLALPSLGPESSPSQRNHPSPERIMRRHISKAGPSDQLVVDFKEMSRNNKMRIIFFED
jgi:hypothetical protein